MVIAYFHVIGKTTEYRASRDSSSAHSASAELG